MKNIIVRVKNAYSYGGIKEIVRKSYFLSIYKINNFLTKKSVERANIEWGLSETRRDEMVIVSLTTFPGRFNQLFLCLKSLVIQSFKPDKIIVYLGSDTNRDLLTKEMRDFEQYGIEYRFDEEKNLMPHKKYYYAMQEYPDSVIVTADDDIIYPIGWLESLYNSYKQYPNAISARRVHLMKKDNNDIAPYDSWEDQCRRIRRPSMSLIATGNSGVLYPPHCFGKEAFDIEAIENLCLRADDIWLKCLEVKYSIPVVWVKNWEVSLQDIDSESNEKLSDENVFTGTNDGVLEKVLDYLRISKEDFFK